MPHRKHPEGEPQDMQIVKAPESLTLQERLYAAFLQEGKRADSFKEYRRIAREYLRLAEEAKASAKESITVLHRLINTRPFPEIVLRTEELIAQSRNALHQVIHMLRHNIHRDSDGLAEHNPDNIRTAALSADMAFDSFTRILRQARHVRGMSSESRRELPPVTDRQKRVAKDDRIPPKIRKREVPRLAGTLLEELRTFAAGNAFSTVGDIDALMKSLQTFRPFFQGELADWRRLDKEVIQPMRDAGMPDDAIRAALAEFHLDRRVENFREMVASYDLALFIASARMEFVNQPDNELLAAIYDRRAIKRLLESDGKEDPGAEKKPEGLRGLLRKITHGRKDAEAQKQHRAAYKAFLRKALQDRKK